LIERLLKDCDTEPIYDDNGNIVEFPDIAMNEEDIIRTETDDGEIIKYLKCPHCVKKLKGKYQVMNVTRTRRILQRV
jgi:hypothetical protein